MRKLIRLSALVLCIVCLLAFCPNTAAYAQEGFEPGDEVIYIDGEPYYLCNTTYEVQPTSLDPGGVSSIKEQVSYTYVDSPGRTLVVIAEVIGSTSIGNTVIVKVKQATEWHYVYGESVELVSNSETVDYSMPGVIVSLTRGGVSYDASGNGTCSASYEVIYQGTIIDASVETSCSIYGNIS